jgi:hypothetical protein
MRPSRKLDLAIFTLLALLAAAALLLALSGCADVAAPEVCQSYDVPISSATGGATGRTAHLTVCSWGGRR